MLALHIAARAVNSSLDAHIHQLMIACNAPKIPECSIEGALGEVQMRALQQRRRAATGAPRNHLLAPRAVQARRGACRFLHHTAPPHPPAPARHRRNENFIAHASAACAAPALIAIPHVNRPQLAARCSCSSGLAPALLLRCPSLIRRAAEVRGAAVQGGSGGGGGCGGQRGGQRRPGRRSRLGGLPSGDRRPR